MPRQKSQATAYLDIYKLQLEKKRLQHRVLELEQQTQQIYLRLKEIDSQIVSIQASADSLERSEAASPRWSPTGLRPSSQPSAIPSQRASNTFKTFVVDY
jgi:cell division septum initiation protein DivIVA